MTRKLKNSGYATWLLKLKYLAHETGIKHLVPEDDSKMLPAFECGWTPEMALDDLMLQSQSGAL